jgi:mono/diheme cytochrome c family protein
MARAAWIGGGLSALCFGALCAPRVEAQPPGPTSFCEVYPDAPACAAGEVSCAQCHTAPPALNPYGAEVSAALLVGAPRPLPVADFLAGLPDALVAVEDLDADGDGYTNIDEIQGGSSPSDADSTPAPAACVDDDDDGWSLCGYDPAYAYKKVMIQVCGRSPTVVERRDFLSERDASAALHRALDRCLDEEHWRGIGGQVWNLANAKIGPLQAIKSGRDVGPIPLADYDDDYAYFVWTQTDGRDARLVLTGQDFVSARRVDGRTVYEVWDRTPDEDLRLRGYDRYQAVTRDRRAGLLTHRWFLMSNTMFTAVPRTTAAQAYRAFLGYDLARLEGLYPVAGEPVDYDKKGVQAEACAACHNTLDPLSYPFSRYEGIGGGSEEAPSYSYNPDRMAGFVRTDGPDVARTPESGFLFGKPVADLRAWAQVAADSEAFRRATVLDYWRLLLGEAPRANEQAEYAALVERFGEDHDVEALLHALIDTEAYGAP